MPAYNLVTVHNNKSVGPIIAPSLVKAVSIAADIMGVDQKVKGSAFEFFKRYRLNKI